MIMLAYRYKELYAPSLRHIFYNFNDIIINDLYRC